MKLSQKRMLLIILSLLCFTASFIMAACAGDIQYLVSVKVDGAGGTTIGGGIFAANSEITITAVPSVGYRFDHWSDEIGGYAISYDQEYTFNTTYGNCVFYANFEPLQKYAVRIMVYGESEIDGATHVGNDGVISYYEAKYFAGETVHLFASIENFDYWYVLTEGLEIEERVYEPAISFVMPESDVEFELFTL